MLVRAKGQRPSVMHLQYFIPSCSSLFISQPAMLNGSGHNMRCAYCTLDAIIVYEGSSVCEVHFQMLIDAKNVSPDLLHGRLDGTLDAIR